MDNPMANSAQALHFDPAFQPVDQDSHAGLMIRCIDGLTFLSLRHDIIHHQHSIRQSDPLDRASCNRRGRIWILKQGKLETR